MTEPVEMVVSSNAKKPIMAVLHPPFGSIKIIALPHAWQIIVAAIGTFMG